MSGAHDRSVPSVVAIQVGRIAPLGSDGISSAFVKSAVAGPVQVGPLGLDGDEQADLTVHGGVDKAVYFYPSEHYPRWAADVPQHAGRLVAGAFGENITAQGIDESDIAIGDVLRIGTAELQVSQPRQPCFKLALRFDDHRLGRLMMQTGRTGWYARVLTSGVIQAGDSIQRTARPNPAWTIARFNDVIRSGRGAFHELAGLEGLAEVWRQAAES